MLRLILLLTLTGALVNSQQDKINYLGCNQSSNCLCMEQGELEIQCPQFDPQIFLRITPHNQVHYECENVTNKEYELVPTYNLEVASFLMVTRCPLIPGTPILTSYLKNIKMERIRTIQFVSSGINKGMQIESTHFEGFDDVTRFDLRGAEDEFEILPSDLFQNLTKVNWLRIRVPKIELPEDLLLPLADLEFLELGHNKIESIPSGFFRNQQKLKHLIFWGNNLRNLSKDTFTGLHSIVDLDLSANGLESLDADLLKPLTNLTEINLSSNNLIALPKGLLSNNTQLKTFKLLENRVIMLTLPEGLFANLTLLSEVFIKCGLQTLPEDVFEGAINIEKLMLESNKLRELPDNVFADLGRLKTLDLSNNLIAKLTKDTFRGLNSLEALRLTRNRLKVIPSRAFFPLTALRTLFLDDNSINEIQNNGFGNLDRVYEINLRNNSLVYGYGDGKLASSPFQELKEMEILDLSYNEIEIILENYPTEKLRVLNLSHNRITSISINDFQSYFSRKEIEIDLSYNNIETIDFIDFEHTDIYNDMRVDINNNPLNCDCKIWDLWEYLNGTESKIKFNYQYLTCSKPDVLVNKTFVKVDPMMLTCPLDSEMTNVKYCPNECQCTKRPNDRTIIYDCDAAFDFNLISSHDKYKTELRIEQSNLTDKLPTITKSPGYKNVTRLHLNNNRIKDIRVDNIPLKLEILDLRFNEIESMNFSVTQIIEELPLKREGLQLEGNFIRCDCENQHYINFIKKLDDKHLIAKFHELECIDGMKIDTLDPSTLCTESKFFVMILCIITAFLGVIIGGLAALYYKYQKQIKMWLYSHDLCLWFVTEEELDKGKKYDAFVSYSHRDEDFIEKYLVPELEHGPIKYKLCVHVRDWAPGIEISTQISNSVNDAKRTIVVMSPNYLQSNWAQWEFRVAQSHAATEKRSRIIIILYGDIGDINKLEPDIRDYLKLNTYVKWGDKWFWEKLKYAMPHVKPSERSEKISKGLMKSSITSSVDDKLELIKPISVTPPQLTTPPAEKIGNPLISSLNAKNNAKNQSARIMNGINGNGNGHINGAFVINTSSRQSDV